MHFSNFVLFIANKKTALFEVLSFQGIEKIAKKYIQTNVDEMYTQVFKIQLQFY